MTDLQQAPDSDDLASKTLTRLKKGERDHEKLKSRLKKFQLFEEHEYTDYKGERKIIPKAKRRAHDGPALQMMIARRDRYESCCKQIALLDDLLAHSESASERGELIKQIVSLEAIADRHARGIEGALASFIRSDGNVQAQRASVLTSAAKLAQADRHHADKIDLARKASPGDMPDAELLRIANGEEAI